LPSLAVYTSVKEVAMRVSTVVLALLGVMTGYALGGTRVHAVEDQTLRFPSGIGVGTRVVMYFSSDPKMIDCTIGRIDAGWVRCAPGETDPFQKVEPREEWYALAHVVSVWKVEPKR
jgi:hypothetical protein